MSIAAQLEITLVGDADHKADILDGLQALGVVHLEDLGEVVPETGPDSADDLREALTYLQQSPRQRRRQRPLDEPDYRSVTLDVLRNKYLREDCADRLELLRQRHRLVQHWGDFKLPTLEAMDGQRLWFYQVPQGREALLDAVTLPWQIVNSDSRYHYVVVVSEADPGEAVPFERSRLGARSLTELEQMREDTLVELEDLNAERESLTRWIVTLQDSLNRSLDSRELQQALHKTHNEAECFALRGWMPYSACPRLSRWIEMVPAGYRLREPTEEDRPPTLLQNEDRYGGGEEAVRFFQLPGYRNWDPSTLIYFSFCAFFAMILADAGYGLLLASGLALYWRRLSDDHTSIRLRNLALGLVSASIVYGVLVGSYFGIRPDPEGVLGKVVVLDMNDFDTMMRLSLGIGTAHLCIAHVMVFMTNRGTRVAKVALGWLLGTASAFGLWLSYMDNPDFSLARSPWLIGIVAWLFLILVYSGDRPLNSPRNVALQVFDGLGGLMGVTKAFGDVLSYMRLFALGLAGSSLAATFNSLAVAARDGSEHFGMLFFLLIVLAGHGLNIVLSLMSGVIHGLRLNLMEFYNWGIQDEGYPFKAFAKRGEARWKNLL